MGVSFFEKVSIGRTGDLYQRLSCDFIGGAIVGWDPGLLVTGVFAYAWGSSQHPGVGTYTSSASANSGCRLKTRESSISMARGAKTTIIFKTSTTLTGVLRRMGFHNSTSHVTPTEGVYAEVVDGVISGQTMKASANSTTTSTYNLAANTWYRLVIEVVSWIATYTLYADDSMVVLWTDTLSTNIPTNPVGHGDNCTYGGTEALLLGNIDYMDIVLPNARRII